eukprot:5210997-Pleurochrysis_carterae.AAC.1
MARLAVHRVHRVDLHRSVDAVDDSDVDTYRREPASAEQQPQDANVRIDQLQDEVESGEEHVGQTAHDHEGRGVEDVGPACAQSLAQL